MTKFRLLINLLIVAIFISSPSTLALPSLNSAPNDDVIAGIKALHRAPEKEMARLKLLLASQQSNPKRQPRVGTEIFILPNPMYGSW